MKQTAVEQYLNLEAQVEEEEEEEEVPLEDEMSGFIINQDPQEEDSDEPDATHDFMADDGMEATALLRIAEEYDACAVVECVIGSFESAEDNKFRVDDKLAIIACQMADTNQNLELYSFKVLISAFATKDSGQCQ